jgi:hypothetical protein
MSYDRVEYDHPDGAKTMSPQEFRALGAVERVKGIGQGRFRFYQDGVKISPTEALRPTARQ